MENLKLVVAGHVDHGKSTLIGRLLFDTNSLALDRIEEMERASENLGRSWEFAFLLDHLQEERDQGITIEATQIFFKTPKREYVIIDAPGHREFVKNMITGASQAEAAVLIVDVREGMQEETRRHAQILSLLGLKQIIVVLNKMDLAAYQEEVFQRVKEETKEFLNFLNINPRYFIPISALGGDGIIERSEKMAWHQGPTVLEGLDSFSAKVSPSRNSLIYAVQDVYKVGAKRINVGRVEAGRIREGQTIKILPERKITQVKSIEKFNEKIPAAEAAESVGIVTAEPLFIERGNIICEPDKEPLLTQNFSANLFWLAKEDLALGELISLKCATQNVPAEIVEIKKRIDSSSLTVLEEKAEKLKNLEVGEVVVKTKKPLALTKFQEIPELGRFVLMRQENICAGGIIV